MNTSNQFHSRLASMVKNFDKSKTKEALALSDEIHDAESRGYQLSRLEDRLWMQLTAKLSS